MDKDKIAIHPAYKENLSKLLTNQKFCGSHQARPDEIFIEVKHKKIILQVSINQSENTVTHASYQGGTRVEQGVLEGLCKILPRLPIREVYDHSLIHLEYELRDSSESLPVPGIVMPENADPVFNTIQVLTKKVFKKYTSLFEKEFLPNAFIPEISLYWKQLSSSQRLMEAKKFCSDFAKRKEIGFQVVEIESVKRIVVEFTTDLNMYKQQSLLMEFESEVKTKLEPLLEVYQKEKKDLNTIRTLNRIVKNFKE